MASPFRVRVATAPPLPPLKAWLTFHPRQSIADFKQQAAQAIGVLDGGPLGLDLGGFALLDSSQCSIFDPVSDVLTLRSGSTIQGSAHLANLNGDSPPPAKKIKLANGVSSDAPNEIAPPVGSEVDQPLKVANEGSDSESEDTSTPSSADSSDSSDSSSESAAAPKKIALPSSSSSSSASSSSSDSDDLVEDPAVKGPAVKDPTPPPRRDLASSKGGPAAVAQQPPAVPPGRGKIRTQLRNARRRKKARFEKERAQAGFGGSSQPQGSAKLAPCRASTDDSSKRIAVFEPQANGKTLSSSASSSSPEVLLATLHSSNGDGVLPTQASAVFPPKQQSAAGAAMNMFSLRNKNKRKNRHRSAGLEDAHGKIYFGKPLSTSVPAEGPSSPRYTPQSPRLGHSATKVIPLSAEEAAIAPTAVPLPLSPPLARTDPAPPPSLREAWAVPDNVFVTGVDVESQDWTPGLVGWEGVGKKRRARGKNQKKRGGGHEKRWDGGKDYAEGKVQNPDAMDWAVPVNGAHPVDKASEGGGHDSSPDDDTPDPEVMQDIEDAYDEFVRGGGYEDDAVEAETRVAEEVGEDEWEGWEGWPDGDRVRSTFSQLAEIERGLVKPGDAVAVSVLELNPETCSPELSIFHGGVVTFTDETLTIDIHPSALPPTDEADVEQLDEDGEEMQISVFQHRLNLKSEQQNALLKDRWAAGAAEQDGPPTNAEPSGADEVWGRRTWNWSNVAQVRRVPVRL